MPLATVQSDIAQCMMHILCTRRLQYRLQVTANYKVLFLSQDKFRLLGLNVGLLDISLRQYCSGLVGLKIQALKQKVCSYYKKQPSKDESGVNSRNVE
jgi:hypothetical protein